MATDADESFLSRITSLASDVIGSWWMILFETVAIGTWFFLNMWSHSPTGHFDNERYDTLRLLVGFQSIYTAPLILMAQRRVGARDRKVLNQIDDFERRAMELRLEAMQRRIRLEEKVDLILAARLVGDASLRVDHAVNVDDDVPTRTDRDAAGTAPR